MKGLLISFGIVYSVLALPPGAAEAQCDGGGSTAGYYLPNGSYVPGGGCGYTNATTLGQLYPSGARPGANTALATGTRARPGLLPNTGPVVMTRAVVSDSSGASTEVSPTQGAPVSTNTSTISGIGGGPNAVAVTRPGQVPSQWLGGNHAYGYSLTAAPPAGEAGIHVLGESLAPP